ncbi:glycine-rich domain-containing protein [Alkalilacustris brevis]|uniref:glycine-rich domain-containing protein n=1 Tax=Alkalilacustris brevis TaxID=2026338 RepID=UPI000E0D325B|nr:hypothetical protein [Alkalilacustris brevis]
MPRLVNRAKITTPTIGTGPLTLGLALEGFQSFASAGVAQGETLRYVLEEGPAWEIGTGTYDAAGPSLTRNVTESSNAGAPIALAGSGVVLAGLTAADLTARDNAVTSVAGRTGAVELSREDVGLDQVDNLPAAALRDRATHGGTQPASTITGLAPVATSGAYADLSGTPPELAPAQVTDPGSGTYGLVNGALLAALGSGADLDHQEFLTSGVWIKPAGLSEAALVIAELWAGGGGSQSSWNNRSRGGGGGGYNRRVMRAADLPDTVDVIVGAGGTGFGAFGGNSAFGDHVTAHGGGWGRNDSDAGDRTGGGGGGELEPGRGGNQGSANLAAGGAVGGGDGVTNAPGGDAGTLWGGGGGAGAGNHRGGRAVLGGGGGGGRNGSSHGLGGESLLAGNGGAAGQNGGFPAGGAGAGIGSETTGGDGFVIVRVIG